MDTHGTHHHRRGRVEDQRLVTGSGKYVADWNGSDQLYGYFVRSDRAHAEIISVNTALALKSPGVMLILTGKDAVEAGYVRAPGWMNGVSSRDGKPILVPDRPALAHGKVRFVGEALALVIATTPSNAEDAAELVDVEYGDLSCVVNAEEALNGNAPQLHEDVPGNLLVEAETGNAVAVAEGFRAATHVTRLKVEVTRITAAPMEPRGCVVTYYPERDEYVFNVCMQGGTTLRRQISYWTGVPESQLKFEALDVGGGFGQRSWAYPEYCALMLAAKASGKPIKWVSTRSEGFLADYHGRSNIVDAELALDRDGKFLAMRMRWINDMGAYLCPGARGHIFNTSVCMSGLYHIPALHALYSVAVTNTTPISPCRGAGRPDGAYVIERLVTLAAAELGIDAVELRKRNLIPAESFPYTTGTGAVYENGDPPGLLEKALEVSNWESFPQRRTSSEAAGKLRGMGIAMTIENTAADLYDELELEVDATGLVTIYTMSLSQGQSHQTSLAIIVADTLGIRVEQVRIVQLPSGKDLKGFHVAGSRTTVSVGSLCEIVAQKLIAQGRALAADELGLDQSQVGYSNGEFRSTASNRTITLAELAAKGKLTLLVGGQFGSTFPNSCHIAEVEIDPDTGVTRIVTYSAVDDFGVIINHVAVEGQVHGGVAMGTGQVFGEHVVYDRETGQMLSGSFLDYFMPRAGLLPELRMASHPTPSKVSPLGVKGVGESGVTASLPTVANAVLDALRPLGITHLDIPLTPNKVWAAIQASKAGLRQESSWPSANL